MGTNSQTTQQYIYIYKRAMYYLPSAMESSICAKIIRIIVIKSWKTEWAFSCRCIFVLWNKCREKITTMNPVEEKKKETIEKKEKKNQQTFNCNKQKICELAKKKKKQKM